MSASSRTDAAKSIARKYQALYPEMDERTRRTWAAMEARDLGYGGLSIVHRATGLDFKTIKKGVADLKELEKKKTPVKQNRRIRKEGGGRKSLRIENPTILKDLDALIEPTVRGDPMSGLRLTCKSTRKLAEELNQKGHKISHLTVAKLMRALLIQIVMSNLYISIKLLLLSSKKEILSFP